jgi:uncharacterized protein (TIGR00255 family)
VVLSMTGFGRGKAEDDSREINIELKTINHRYLDINLRMPRSLFFLEDEVRKYIQQAISRGRVEAYIGYNNKANDQITVTVNQSVANAYIDAFKELAALLQTDERPGLAVLSDIDDIFTITEQEEDEESLRCLMFNALDQALQVLIQMRQKEGQYLAEDIWERSKTINDMLDAIEARSPLVVEEYRNKLEQRLKDLLKTTDLDEARFNTEVAYFADRSNITEEIIRLRSHIIQLQQTLKAESPIGRKLDFIVQEMNREANTIGSKSSDVTITNKVVEIKSELEKIREQVQNLE